VTLDLCASLFGETSFPPSSRRHVSVLNRISINRPDRHHRLYVINVFIRLHCFHTLFVMARANYWSQAVVFFEFNQAQGMSSGVDGPE